MLNTTNHTGQTLVGIRLGDCVKDIIQGNVRVDQVSHIYDHRIPVGRFMMGDACRLAAQIPHAWPRPDAIGRGICTTQLLKLGQAGKLVHVDTLHQTRGGVWLDASEAHHLDAHALRPAWSGTIVRIPQMAAAI